MLSLAERALEAWAECQPEGMTLPEDRFAPERLSALLSGIASHVPGGLASPESARRLHELFNSKDQHKESSPVFLGMLKPRNGQVHFLNFWLAFSEASRIVAGPEPQITALEDELRRLCDRISQLLDAEVVEGDLVEGSGCRKQRVRATVLAEAIQAVAAVSSEPNFWTAVANSMVGLEDEAGELGPEEVAVVTLSWLHDAVAWQQMSAAQGSADERPQPQPSSSSRQDLFLNVYDVSQEERVQKLNKVLAHKNSPLKFGGVFHVGVEIDGLEWSYGCSTVESVPGVSCTLPREHPQHHFRQTIGGRRTPLSPEDIADIISQMIEEYPGDDYDLLRRNCCHFADDFCQRLRVSRIPGWVHRLARVGAGLDGALQVAQGLHDRFKGILTPEDDRNQSN